VPKIKVKNLEINYNSLGQKGPVLVILHGWGIDGSRFEELGKLLSDKFKVIIPDLPGFGKSDSPKKPWSVSDYTDFILDFMEQLKINQFYLLGHSFGGRVGIKMGIEHADRLKGLVLCCAAGIKPRPRVKGVILLILSKLGNLIFSLPLLKEVKQKGRKFFYKIVGKRDYTELKGVMKKTFLKAIREDLKPLLKEIKADTLLLWGDKDRLTPLRDGEMMKREILHSELKIVKGVGHRLPYEKPKKIANIIFNFLKERK